LQIAIFSALTLSVHHQTKAHMETGGIFYLIAWDRMLVSSFFVLVLVFGIFLLLNFAWTAKRIGYTICGFALVMWIFAAEAPYFIAFRGPPLAHPNIFSQIPMWCVWLVWGWWVCRGFVANQKNPKPDPTPPPPQQP
jgi:hypothetical protein